MIKLTIKIGWFSQ